MKNQRLFTARSIGAALSVVAALMLSACGSGGSQPETGGGDYQGQTITVTSFGGDWEETFIEAVVKPFEDETGAKVELTTLYSSDAYAQITAQASSPQIDVVHFSGGQEHAAAEDGLLDPVPSEGLSAYSDLIEPAVTGLDKGEGPAIQLAPIGLVFRTDVDAPAPSSWNDLFDPAYKGHIALADFSNTYGVLSMLRVADTVGGGIENAGPAIEKLGGLAASGDAIVVPTSPDLQSAFAQRDTWLAPYAMDYAGTLQDAGLPVEFIVPEEGATASRVTANLVAGRDNNELATLFIDFELRPEAQEVFAERMRYTPVNTAADVSGDSASQVLSADEAEALTIYSPEEIDKNRQAWTDQWNELIAR